MLGQATIGGYCTENGANVSRTDISRQAEEALGTASYEPGEHVAGSAEVTSNPSRWGIAAFLALVIALAAVLACSALRTAVHPPAGAFAAPLLPLVTPLGLLLRRPMLVVVTSQRLICLQLSRFRRAPRRLVFAVPLAEVRIAAYRPSKYASSIQFEIPGHKRSWLDAGRAGRKDFAKVEEALTRSGAFAKLDPPWPATPISYTRWARQR